MITVRPEKPKDNQGIYAVNEQTFPTVAEAELVDALRVNNGIILSLVAESKDGIVGHALFSPVTIVGDHDRFAAVGLGPLAVLPTHQRQGIGTQLVEAGLAQLRRDGHHLVVVLGHSAYYPRFGFSQANKVGIHFAGDVPADAFMVLPLTPAALDGVQGIASYRSEFAGV